MFDEHEPAKPELTPELAALERHLASLTPSAPRLDRDRLMFEAGRASVAAQPRRMGYIADRFGVGARLWPAATATMTAATVLLGTMLVRQQQAPTLAARMPSATNTAVQTVDQSQSAVTALAHETTIPARLSLPQSTTGYLGIRYVALTQGVSALQSSIAAKTSGKASVDSQNPERPTARDLMNELLPTPTANHDTLPRS